MSRTMKDSGIPWIGEIPEGWKVGKVKNFYRFITGFTPDTKNDEYYDNENGTPWATISDLSSKYVESTKSGISELYISLKHPTIIPINSLLYSFKLSVGQVAKTKIELYTNEAIAAFLPTENISLDYLYYSSQICIIENANENIYGAKLLNQDLIYNSVIVFPPLAEQHLIATFLDKKCSEIDSLIDLQEQMIEELKAYKQSVITEAVTKGLNPNVPMKDSGIEWIGDVPEEWEVCRIRNLGITQNGISKGGEFFGEGEPFISYSDVYKNIELPQIASGLIQSSQEEQDRFSVCKGDVFFTRTSETIEEIGFSSTCTKTIEKAVYAGFLIRFRPKQGVLNDGYSKYYFRSDVHRAYFVKEMNIVTRASLSQDLLKSLVVLLPPISEQQAIADYLDKKCGEIDELITIKQQKIESLKEYKKSVIYEYVTGKREV